MDTKWVFHFQAFITHTVPVLQIFHCCYRSMERELCLEDLDSPDREQCYSVCFDLWLLCLPHILSGMCTVGYCFANRSHTCGFGGVSCSGVTDLFYLTFNLGTHLPNSGSPDYPLASFPGSPPARRRWTVKEGESLVSFRTWCTAYWHHSYNELICYVTTRACQILWQR